MHVARLPLDAAGPVAGARAAAARDLAHRRALRRVLRARAGEGERAAGRAGVHLGNGRRQLHAGGDRGARGARSADRPHRGPPARAARRRRRSDDRPDQALRQRREVVQGDRRPTCHRGAPALAAGPRLPRVLDRARRPPRTGAPQLLAARAARARRSAAARGARRRRTGRWQPVGPAPGVTGDRPRRDARGARGRARTPAAHPDRGRAHGARSRARRGARRLRRARAVAAAGRADLRRPSRTMRRRALRRAAARPGMGRGAGPGAGAAGRRPADVQGAAPVAARAGRGHAADRARSRERLAGSGRSGGAVDTRRPAHAARSARRAPARASRKQLAGELDGPGPRRGVARSGRSWAS